MDGRAHRAQLAAVSAFLILAIAACTDSKSKAPEADVAPMPIPRTEVAGASWRGGIAVAGGFLADGGASDSAHLYSVTADAWRALPSLPAARHHSTAAVVGDRLYIVGGYDEQSTAMATVWSLGPNEAAWRHEPPLPAGRAAHGLGSLNGRLVAAGGVVNGAPTNTSVVLDGGAWRDGPPLATAREHLASAVAGGRMYVIAGRVGGDNFTVVESWDGADPGWRTEPSLNDERGGIAADEINGAPCVAGGEELTPGGKTIASVECLRDGKWERVAELAQPRHGLAVAALGRDLHVIAGGRRPGLTVSGTHEVLAL